MTEADDDSDTLPYSRVLVKAPGFYRTLRRKDGFAWYYDASSLPYLIEEFIAASAIRIAVTAKAPGVDHLDSLPAILRSHVIVVDKEREAGKAVAAMLDPLANEFQFIFEEPPGHLAASKAVSPAVNEALGTLLPMLYDFFLGAEHQLQIDIDLPLMKKTLSFLRASARTPESRTHLAMLEGVFGSYKEVEVSSLALKSAATDAQVEHFRHFVEDVAYQRASRGAALLGVPEDGDRALQMIKRGLAAVIRKPFFKPLVNLTSFALWRATPVSGATEDLVQELLPIRYYPPILQLDRTYDLAKAQWAAQRAPFVETEELVALLGAGWTEISGVDQPTELDFAKRGNANH